MQSLPLFHRIAGQPVVVLGQGEAAAAKRRLVQRAGGVVVDDLAEGIDTGARLAFIAHDDDRQRAPTPSARGRGPAGQRHRPPGAVRFHRALAGRSRSGADRGGHGRASAGLAKALRLRLERLLPQGLGGLALALHAAREAVRALASPATAAARSMPRWSRAGRSIHGGAPADAVEHWLGGAAAGLSGRFVIALRSDDPDDLTCARRACWAGRRGDRRPDVPPPPARARADAVACRPARSAGLNRDRPDPEGLSGLRREQEVHPATGHRLVAIGLPRFHARWPRAARAGRGPWRRDGQPRRAGIRC
jgi:uroporphyrin-III C-methyltransferase/precorrin-2 dehydrogenase/sirohydrochlorin ferrochelatase